MRSNASRRAGFIYAVGDFSWRSPAVLGNWEFVAVTVSAVHGAVCYRNGPPAGKIHRPSRSPRVGSP